MKATLDRQFLYQGKRYGPGEAELPDELHTSLKARGYIVDAQNQAAPALPIVGGQPEQELKDPLAAFEMLLAAGYTVDTARDASDEELLAVKGVGQATLRQIRTALGTKPETT